MEKNYIIMAVSNDSLELPIAMLLDYEEMQAYSNKTLVQCYRYIHYNSLDKKNNCRYIKVKLKGEMNVINKRGVKNLESNSKLNEKDCEIIKRYLKDDINCIDAANMLGTSRSNFFRILKKMGVDKKRIKNITK